MKQIFFIILHSILPLAMFAGNGDKTVADMVAAYNKAKGISASYAISSPDGNYAGNIIMQGNKFRILSPDMICWFDGKTQWSYSTISQEVNIMQPTAEELQIVNPIAIISNFRTGYDATLLKAPSATTIRLRLSPRKDTSSDIKSVEITADKKTLLPQKITFSLNDRTQMNVIISNYTTGKNYPTATFSFDKKMVPAGTPVVDLR